MSVRLGLTTLERGVLGGGMSITGVILSLLSHVEVYLRLGGLLVGLAVGIVTLISVSIDVQKKLKKK